MKDGKFFVLFVCSGNSCRSPMAEGLLKIKLPKALEDRVIVQSAGTLGINGSPATEYAITAAGEYGADIARHLSQGVTEELSAMADVIFVMSREHRTFFEHYMPDIRENVFLLKTFDTDPEDVQDDSIPDPVGHNLDVYMTCCETIDHELNRIRPRLIRMIEEKLQV
jgi:protein-tyrosine phosphatase